MSPFDPVPAFRGATYSDELRLVDADTGAAVPFMPALDALTWRLFRTGPSRGGPWGGWGGLGPGWDYGFASNPGAALDLVAMITLTLGQGLSITGAGTALWAVPNFPLWLREPEYRMTLDLVRYGEVCRVMDAVLQVED